MTQDEKSVASILLANIANSVEEGDSVARAIARYQEFVEACNFRRRCLVNGWTELESLVDIPEDEATEEADASDDIEWWVATLDQYGNPTLYDGAHGDKESAEKSVPLLRAVNPDIGKLAVVRVVKEIYL